ncbi:MAG: hypothetical protein ACJ77C_10590 [Chloroflexota bacterium]
MWRLGAVILAVTLAMGATGCVGCPLALLEGELVPDGVGGLAVRTPAGGVASVIWPDGVGIGHEGDELVLTNQLGLPIAHEGEFVSMAGGVPGESPTFDACGPIAVRASALPTR